MANQDVKFKRPNVLVKIIQSQVFDIAFCGVPAILLVVFGLLGMLINFMGAAESIDGGSYMRWVGVSFMDVMSSIVLFAALLDKNNSRLAVIRAYNILSFVAIPTLLITTYFLTYQFVGRNQYKTLTSITFILATFVCTVSVKNLWMMNRLGSESV